MNQENLKMFVEFLEQGTVSKCLKELPNESFVYDLIPELNNLKGVEQDVYYHSEGDVFTHTMLVLDKAQHTVVAQLSALLHDIAKPKCKEVLPQENDNPPRIKFIGHEKIGSNMTEEILARIGFDSETVRKVKKIVSLHLRPMFSKDWSDKALNKFIKDCGDVLDEVLNLAEADTLSSFGLNGQPKENLIPKLRHRINCYKKVDQTIRQS